MNLSAITIITRFILVTPYSATSEEEGSLAFPSPATDVVYLTLKGNNKYTGVCLTSNTGQLLKRSTLPFSATTVRFELPASLAAGIYFLKVTGAGATPLMARVMKK